MSSESIRIVGIALMFAVLAVIIAFGLIFTRMRIKQLDNQRKEAADTKARIKELADRMDATQTDLKRMDDDFPETKRC